MSVTIYHVTNVVTATVPKSLSNNNFDKIINLWCNLINENNTNITENNLDHIDSSYDILPQL